MSATRQFFAGMRRTCKRGHRYVVTEYMCKRQSYECKKCAVIRSVEYARRNRAKKRLWNYEYFLRHGRKQETTTRYRKKHPDRYAAHLAVKNALRSGSLKKKPCKVCGNKKVHGHHENYKNPLKVEWLCHAHHMERHWNQ